jgi:hypothetical protein
LTRAASWACLLGVCTGIASEWREKKLATNEETINNSQSIFPLKIMRKYLVDVAMIGELQEEVEEIHRIDVVQAQRLLDERDKQHRGEQEYGDDGPVLELHGRAKERGGVGTEERGMTFAVSY